VIMVIMRDSKRDEMGNIYICVYVCVCMCVYNACARLGN
jgi:hypothetical protein